MECKRAQEFLSFYVHGELDAFEQEPVEKHLQICGACTRKLEEYKVVRQALSGLPEVRVPPDFLVRVRSRLGEPETFWDRVELLLEGLTLRRLPAGAALAALVGVTTFHAELRMGYDARSVSEVRVARGDPASAPLLADAPKSLVAADEVPSERAEEDRAPASIAAFAQERAAPVADVSAPAGRGDAPAEAAGAPRTSHFHAREVRLAMATPAARPDAAESFDASWDTPAASSSEVTTPQPISTRRAAPAFTSGTDPAGALATRLAAATRPDSPFLTDDLAGAAGAAADAPARDLDAMGEAELSREIDDLLEGEEGAVAPDSLFIFDPASDATASAAAPNFATGEGMRARLSTPDRVARRARTAPAAPVPASMAPEPRFEPVALAWVRTRFGRKVIVKGPEDLPLEVPVARHLEVRTARPADFLAGMHSLLEAGLGLELVHVVVWDGSEIEVLVRCGEGDGGGRVARRFVSDVRNLAGGDVVSDVSLGGASGQSYTLRVLVPNLHTGGAGLPLAEAGPTH